MIGAVLTLGALAFALAALLTPAVRRLGLRRALLDSAGSSGHRKQLRPIPNIGGVAIAWAILMPLLGGVAGAWIAPASLWTQWAPGIAEHVEGMRAETPLAIALAASVLWLHILGLIDDRRPLGPWLKLILMATPAAVVILAFDVRLLTALQTLLGAPGLILSILLTLAWFIVVTNAMNFMDNMDGLAAGVTTVAATLFCLSASLNGQWFVAMTLALTAGAAAGFLVWNFHPARIFMGDGGSLVLGFLLAFLTVRTTWIGPDAGVSGRDAWYGVLMPLCVLAVPLYDFSSVVLIRLAQRRNPMVGDQQHFSHRLRDRGLSVRQVFTVICGCAAATGVSGVLLGNATGWQATLIGAQVLLVLSLIAVYEHGARRGPDA